MNQTLKQAASAGADAITTAVRSLGLEAQVDSLMNDGPSTIIKIKLHPIGRDLDYENFEYNAPLIGLSKADYKRTFTFRKRMYTITGANPQASKYPVEATRDDGKRFKFTTNMVTPTLPT